MGNLPLGIDSQAVLIQLGADYINGELNNLQAQYSTENIPAPDRLAYGIAAEWNGTWYSVYPGTNLTLGLFVQRDFQGNSHFWGNFAEDRTTGTVSLTANIGNAWEASMGVNLINQNNPHFSTQDTANLSIIYKF